MGAEKPVNKPAILNLLFCLKGEMMKIDSKDDFLGVPILTIRNFLHRSRKRCGGSVSENFARQVLKLGAECCGNNF